MMEFLMKAPPPPHRDDAEADAKKAARAAQMSEAEASMCTGLEGLYTSKGGDVAAIFEVCR